MVCDVLWLVLGDAGISLALPKAPLQKKLLFTARKRMAGWVVSNRAILPFRTTGGP